MFQVMNSTENLEKAIVGSNFLQTDMITYKLPLETIFQLCLPSWIWWPFWTFDNANLPINDVNIYIWVLFDIKTTIFLWELYSKAIHHLLWQKWPNIEKWYIVLAMIKSCIAKIENAYPLFVFIWYEMWKMLHTPRCPQDHHPGHLISHGLFCVQNYGRKLLADSCKTNWDSLTNWYLSCGKWKC